MGHFVDGRRRWSNFFCCFCHFLAAPAAIQLEGESVINKLFVGGDNYARLFEF